MPKSYVERKQVEELGKSAFEQRVMHSLLDRKVRFSYESERLDYLLPVHRGVCVTCGGSSVFSRRYYTPDIFLANGVIVELKGKWTPAQRTQFLRVREAHPDRDIRIVFLHDNNYLNKKKKTSYTDWCEQKGIEYAVGDIPDEWAAE